MNQYLKHAVYGKGSQRHVNFMSELCGMNEDEKSVLQMLHERKSDLYIQEALTISKNTYLQIEESVRAKLLLGIFECINKTMDLFDKE